MKVTDLVQPIEYGIFYDLDHEAYLQIPALNSSALNEARRSLRHFKHLVEVGSDEEKDYLEFGSLTHTCILQHDLFKKKTLITDIESKTLKAYKEAVKEFPDLRVLTKKEADKLLGMMQSIAEDPACMNLIKDGKPEVTVVVKCPDTGVNMKARFDWVSTKESRPYILDYKTTQDAKPTYIPDPDEFDGYIRSSKFEINASNYGYENQAAWYLNVAKIAGIKAEYFALLAQEKTAPFVACPYVYERETIEEAHIENERMKARIVDAIKTGNFPGYAQKPVVIARPDFKRGTK